jgi:hypothetical protein
MLRSPVKLALSALAVVLSCSQSAPNGSSNGGNAAIAGALDAASVAAMRGQTLRISVVGTQTATQADASGRFALSGLPAGTAGVRFQAPGIDSTLQIRGLVPRQTMRISVRINGRAVTLVGAGNQARMVGSIDAIGTNTLTISGVEIDVNDQTKIVARGATITFADLKVNQIVAVQGPVASGKVTAALVNLLLPANFDQILLQGTIDAGSLAAPKFTVSGLIIATDANTKFRRGITFADLKEGDAVVVQGTLQPDGTVLANIVRDLAAEAGQAVEIEGAITAVTPPDQFVVNGTTIVVNADTVIVGEEHHRGPGSRDLRLITGRSSADHGGDDDDQPLTFADLKVGDEVEVEGVAQADGSVLAMRVEVENEDDDGRDD